MRYGRYILAETDPSSSSRSKGGCDAATSCAGDTAAVGPCAHELRHKSPPTKQKIAKKGRIRIENRLITVRKDNIASETEGNIAAANLRLAQTLQLLISRLTGQVTTHKPFVKVTNLSCGARRDEMQ